MVIFVQDNSTQFTTTSILSSISSPSVFALTTNLNNLSANSTLSINNLNNTSTSLLNKTNFTNLLVSGASTINSSLNVSGQSTLNNVNIGGNLNVYGTTSIINTVINNT